MSWEGFAGEEQREKVHLHHLFTAEEFEQHPHPLARRQHLHHGRLHAAERAVGKLDLFAFRDARAHGQDLLFPLLGDFLAQRRDEIVRHFRHLSPKRTSPRTPWLYITARSSVLRRKRASR